MPPNTSATGGYLAPFIPSTPAREVEDDAFLDFMHDVFVGVTGLDPKNVRPRWQPTPANMPPRNTDWMAFGISESVPDAFGYEAHDGTGNGQTAMIVYEDTVLLCAFYGSNAERFARTLRSGLLLSQNREVMTTAQIAVKRMTGPTPAPSLFKEQWLYRSDLAVTLRRQIRSVYPILNILEGVGVVKTDKPPTVTPFDTGT